MKLRDVVEEAFFALNANRLRAALTMLGIIIGVSSVILMLAIGEGTKKNVANSIASLGANQVIVSSGAGSSGGLRGGSGSLPTLTLDDAAAIGDLNSVRRVAPVSNSPAQIVYGAVNKATSVTGTSPPYFNISNMVLSDGDFFTDTDVRTSSNVAVVGATVAKEVFGDASPLGQVIRIQRQTFTVIGVLKAKGQGFGGQDQDDVIVLPITTAQRKLSGSVFAGSVSTIMVEAKYPDQKGYAEEEIRLLLRQRHRIDSGKQDDFNVQNLSSVTQTLESVGTIISLLLVAVGAICLFVGGIGIMNIMLVSVTERTREIGVRMALGGNRKSIMLQFLLEAIVLSLVGAIVGVGLGVGGGLLISLTGKVTAIFSLFTIAVSLLMALSVGVGFGYWPAVRAARLEPVEALRYQ